MAPQYCQRSISYGLVHSLEPLHVPAEQVCPVRQRPAAPSATPARSKRLTNVTIRRSRSISPELSGRPGAEHHQHELGQLFIILSQELLLAWMVQRTARSSAMAASRSSCSHLSSGIRSIALLMSSRWGHLRLTLALAGHFPQHGLSWGSMRPPGV